MKKETIISIVTSLKSISDVITSEIVETVKESASAMEARARHAQIKNEWFSRFKSLPASYRVTTFRGHHTKVEFETDSAVLICGNEGGEVNVATPYVDEEGNNMYLVRDIYGVDEYAIPREEVTLLYKGSVENCWLRWMIANENNLG